MPEIVFKSSEGIFCNKWTI